jgi:hypothetical protein
MENLLDSIVERVNTTTIKSMNLMDATVTVTSFQHCNICVNEISETRKISAEMIIRNFQNLKVINSEIKKFNKLQPE